MKGSEAVYLLAQLEGARVSTLKAITGDSGQDIRNALSNLREQGLATATEVPNGRPGTNPKRWELTELEVEWHRD